MRCKCIGVPGRHHADDTGSRAGNCYRGGGKGHLEDADADGLILPGQRLVQLQRPVIHALQALLLPPGVLQAVLYAVHVMQDAAGHLCHLHVTAPRPLCPHMRMHRLQHARHTLQGVRPAAPQHLPRHLHGGRALPRMPAHEGLSELRSGGVTVHASCSARSAAGGGCLCGGGRRGRGRLRGWRCQRIDPLLWPWRSVAALPGELDHVLVRHAAGVIQPAHGGSARGVFHALHDACAVVWRLPCGTAGKMSSFYSALVTGPHGNRQTRRVHQRLKQGWAIHLPMQRILCRCHFRQETCQGEHAARREGACIWHGAAQCPRGTLQWRPDHNPHTRPARSRGRPHAALPAAALMVWRPACCRPACVTSTKVLSNRQHNPIPCLRCMHNMCNPAAGLSCINCTAQLLRSADTWQARSPTGREWNTGHRKVVAPATARCTWCMCAARAR